MKKILLLLACTLQINATLLQLAASLQELSRSIPGQKITKNALDDILKETFLLQPYSTDNITFFKQKLAAYAPDITIDIAHHLLLILFNNKKFCTPDNTLFGIEDEVLSWHNTTMSWTRIMLTIDIVTDLLATYPDKTATLNIVALASGELLQEYLLMRALYYVGYHNIMLQLIDPIYGFASLQNKYIQNLKQLLESSLKSVQFRHPVSLKHGISALPTQEKPIVVIPWLSAFDYVQWMATTPAIPRTSTCFMVSPSSGLMVAVGPQVLQLHLKYSNCIHLRSLENFLYKIYKPYNQHDFFIAADTPLNPAFLQSLSPCFGAESIYSCIDDAIQKFVKDTYMAGTSIYVSSGDIISIGYYDVLLHTTDKTKNTYGYEAGADTIAKEMVNYKKPYWQYFAKDTHAYRYNIDTKMIEKVMK